MDIYNVIGIMSGTSLDGVDIAFCIFQKKLNIWNFEIVKAQTFDYNKTWKEKLNSLHRSNALSFVKTHAEYGDYLGELVNGFLEKNTLNPDFIASHGHTIFHQPQEKLTFQIGDGAAIAAKTKFTVVSDFRNLDVKLGGQGAPLVPIGDKLLFPQYDYCLNLGGFANISFDNEANQRIAFDICPVNIVLNKIAAEFDFAFDDKGKIAKSGYLNPQLLLELDALDYYNQKNPKSLGKEWVIEYFEPILKKINLSASDKLRTVCEHIAKQISKAITHNNSKSLLISGGGAYNDFLINRIKAHTNQKIHIPENKIIDFKEAMIFAFLGVLKMRGEINCLKSVTGASKDSSGGVIFNLS
ncbi:MAG: anhydro-N-acetylmuramic acid kinase [Bacteroidales bacterium]|nr:anhydro-N-acetylmuramic acid kinase [Bacteroidales bacterium]